MENSLTKLKPKRRWMQVSLRTLLVLVTLLCIALAMWVEPAERQRRAVAAIEALGGKIEYVSSAIDTESRPKRILRRWLPQAYIDEVWCVYLAETQITDAGLAHLQGLTGLRTIVLDKTQITDVGLTTLQGLTGLQVLWLQATQVSDAGLTHLQGLTGLQLLHLTGTRVTQEGVAQLRRVLPRCEIVRHWSVAEQQRLVTIKARGDQAIYGRGLDNGGRMRDAKQP